MTQSGRFFRDLAILLKRNFRPIFARFTIERVIQIPFFGILIQAFMRGGTVGRVEAAVHHGQVAKAALNDMRGLFGKRHSQLSAFNDGNAILLRCVQSTSARLRALS